MIHMIHIKANIIATHLCKITHHITCVCICRLDCRVPKLLHIHLVSKERKNRTGGLKGEREEQELEQNKYYLLFLDFGYHA